MNETQKFFLGIDGEQIGPYSKQEVWDKVERAEVRDTDLVWWEGQPKWILLSESEFFEKAPPKEEKLERKRPQIGGDVESVLSGTSNIESHPTFAQGPDAEPAFKVSHASKRSFIDSKKPLLVGVVVMVAIGAFVYLQYFSDSDTEVIPDTAQKLKMRSLKDRQAVFSKAVSTLMTNSTVSVGELQNLIKENPTDEISKQAVEQLTSFFRTMQRYGDAGNLMMQIGRPDEAVRFFSLDPSLTADNEKATWAAYKATTKPEERRQFLLQNIQILVGSMQDIPKAVERIKILEMEFPRNTHPYSYYLKGTDEKISDLFSRTSFYFVQSLITYLNSELPQLRLSSRPLVEIKKSKTEMYKIVGSYRGDAILNQDKLKDVYFTFWFANETWHIVDTNLTKERRAYAIKERDKIVSHAMTGEAMLRYMEGVFRAQFPKVALHEAVELKK